MTANDTSQPLSPRSREWPFWVWIALVLAIPLVPFAIIGELPGERWLSSADRGAWLFAVAGAGLLASDTLLPIPSSILATALGARLGWMFGSLAAFAGLMVGNLIGYALGCWLSRRNSIPIPQGPGLGLLIVTRPVPVLAEAMAVTAGGARMGLIPFVIAGGAANAVVALVYAGCGAKFLPEGWVGPGLAIPLGLPVLSWLLWRWVRAR